MNEEIEVQKDEIACTAMGQTGAVTRALAIPVSSYQERQRKYKPFSARMPVTLWSPF